MTAREVREGREGRDRRRRLKMAERTIVLDPGVGVSLGHVPVPGARVRVRNQMLPRRLGLQKKLLKPLWRRCVFRVLEWCALTPSLSPFTHSQPKVNYKDRMMKKMQALLNKQRMYTYHREGIWELIHFLGNTLIQSILLPIHGGRRVWL